MCACTGVTTSRRADGIAAPGVRWALQAGRGVAGLLSPLGGLLPDDWQRVLQLWISAAAVIEPGEFGRHR